MSRVGSIVNFNRRKNAGKDVALEYSEERAL